MVASVRVPVPYRSGTRKSSAARSCCSFAALLANLYEYEYEYLSLRRKSDYEYEYSDSDYSSCASAYRTKTAEPSRARRG
eukprot:scaffold23715_cov43-Prasinocladus_malaysianus.AAC.1